MKVLIHKRIKCNGFLQIAPLLHSLLSNKLRALTLLEGGQMEMWIFKPHKININ